MSSRTRSFYVVLTALMLVTASNGANAASQGKQSGGQPSGGSNNTVHPALQQCKGPTNQCGKPIVKCHTITVMWCYGKPGRPGQPPTDCLPKKFSLVVTRPNYELKAIRGNTSASVAGIGLLNSCQQNGDVPKSPFNNRQPQPS